jgi:uncharacterized protein (DUF736 family)
MKTTTFVAVMVASLVLASPAGARTHKQKLTPGFDWRIVEAIPLGTIVSVDTGRGWHHCVFERADDNYLECSIDAPRFPVSLPALMVPPQILRRENVVKVRLENPYASAAAGAGIGAAVGLGVGAMGKEDTATTREGNEVIGGALGALIGGLIGRATSFVHGDVIYQR